MKLIDINPHIRCAQQFMYKPHNNHVYIKDCRLFYISDGKCKISIDNNLIELKKDTMFYCCGGSDYTFIPDKNIENKSIQLYSINFDLTQNYSYICNTFIPENYNKTNNHTPVDSCYVEDSSFLNSFFVYENAYYFKDMIIDITNEFLLNRFYFREYSGSILKSILINLHRISLNNPSSVPSGLQKVIEYINFNFDKEINNSLLAKISGYHEFYLNRLFNKHIGMSMHKYIINLRINKSKYLLLNTDMSVSEIAIKIGFNSNTHFSTMFKKELSVTPFEYRNKLRKNI